MRRHRLDFLFYSLLNRALGGLAVRYVSHLARNGINYAAVNRKPLQAVLAHNNIPIAWVVAL